MEVHRAPPDQDDNAKRRSPHGDIVGDDVQRQAKRQHCAEEAGGLELQGMKLGTGPRWCLRRTRECIRGMEERTGSNGTASPPPQADQEEEPGVELSGLRALCGTLLEQAFSCSELADVSFEFDDGKSLLSGHRAVLSAVSYTFKGMFRSGMQEAKTGRVPVHGVSRQSFRGFLEWVYLGRGGSETAASDGRELWVLAEFFDLASLKAWLLEKGVHGGSVGAAVQFALEAPWGRKELVGACLRLASGGLTDLDPSDFRGVSYKAARALLSSQMQGRGGLQSVRELGGFLFARMWCDANGVSLGSRGEECAGMLELVDFERMRSKDLERVVKLSGLVSEDAVRRLIEKIVAEETLGAAMFGVERSYGTLGAGPEQFGAAIRGVAVHGSGATQRVAACDRINHRVHVFLAGTGRLVMTLGREGNGQGEFVFPVGAAFNGEGHLLVTDMVAGSVQVFDEGGAFLRVIGQKAPGDGQTQKPYGVAVNSGGDVCVVDGARDRVQVFRADGSYVRCIGSKGSGPGEFSHPGGLAIGPGDSIVVADSGNSRVQVFSAEGEFIRSFGTAEGADEGREGNGPGYFQIPSGVAVGARGEILVSDRGRKDVQVFDWQGRYLQTIGPQGESKVGLECPWGIAVDAAGKIFMGDIGSVHMLGDCE
eukprot:CAMPEP_0174921868 /NCGR_PEP_ID=MMETSP1355-20121228/5461_1 /TAXON_ID=464990 /ORGANISM="Hemiselmis tepida, Strain CCMP443" /LENGTH=651 /DNA_ID=CAMNT_0016167399 /DNA_START=8 /DNA_END=1963 /DNA_ORIENTATION=-